MEPKRPIAKIASLAVVASVLALSIVVWQHLDPTDRRLQRPAVPETEEVPSGAKIADPQTTPKARSKSRMLTVSAKQANIGVPGSFRDPYACDGECPPGYDVFNTTGTEAEARWLHAAGFPTPAEYESLTRDEAALAEARRRALAGDSRAEGILGAYYLEQKDYSETLRMAVRGATACNIYALRVNAQREIGEVEVGRDTGTILGGAIDLQVAYLLGDQDAALELGSLLRASNMGPEVVQTYTNLVMRIAASRLDGYRQMYPVACQHRGLRPTPR